MAHDPGFKGMLSFLDMPPAEKKRLLELRSQVDAISPATEQPLGELPELPRGQPPMGRYGHDIDLTNTSTKSTLDEPMGEQPMGLLESQQQDSNLMESKRPMGQSPTGQQPLGTPQRSAIATRLLPATKSHIAQLLDSTDAARESAPYYLVEGVGRRRLHYCTSVQDAHTSGEIVAYQTLWTHAKRNGRADSAGFVIDLGLKELCGLWRTDHKHAKHLLTMLIEKQNLEILRQPNYQAGIPTRYRVFNFTNIYERRRNLGLVWVLRTRTIRFVDLQVVNQLISESSMGEQPMGELAFESEPPTGEQPQTPVGQQSKSPVGQQPTLFIKETNKESIQGTQTSTAVAPVIATTVIQAFGFVDDEALQTLTRKCRENAPDATNEEIAELAAMTSRRISRIRNVDNPVGLLIRQTANCFVGEPFAIYRRQKAEQERRLATLYQDETLK
jgi:hypothetical protein